MIRRLYLKGYVCNREHGREIVSYYSWPWGLEIKFVEVLIESFKNAFCRVTIELEHYYED